MVGIGLAVAVLVIVLSVMNGFENELQQRILSIVSHATVSGIDESLEDWPVVREPRWRDQTSPVLLRTSTARGLPSWMRGLLAFACVASIRPWSVMSLDCRIAAGGESRGPGSGKLQIADWHQSG
ncbi:MAG: hypothetical protein CM1200mP36_00920 [Gammaproteobacteria bacterium]|nr:MAG: hypothetical protein CM1200mP36_00920 [Gammaproteobacteria bacterium]